MAHRTGWLLAAAMTAATAAGCGQPTRVAALQGQNQQLQAQLATAKQAAADLHQRVNKLQSANADLSRRLQQAQSQRDQARDQADQAGQRAVQAADKLAQAAALLKADQARLAALAVQATQPAAERQKLQQQVATLQKDKQLLQTQLTGASKMIAAASTNYDKLQAEVKAQQDLLESRGQLLAVLRRELAQRDAELGRVPGAPAAAPPSVSPPAPAGVSPPPPARRPAVASRPVPPKPASRPAGGQIVGQITQSRADMARADLGAAAGVQRGMKLPVYHGGKLVGYLNVSEVTPADCAGFIIQPRGDIHVGDRVTLAAP